MRHSKVVYLGCGIYNTGVPSLIVPSAISDLLASSSSAFMTILQDHEPSPDELIGKVRHEDNHGENLICLYLILH